MHAAGGLDEVLADESRPLLQGGRLTAWELGQAGVPHRLIVDGAAGAAMAAGLVDAVVVGCDRVAANGDTANKVGTYALAVLARHHGIPFHVAGPLSSLRPRHARRRAHRDRGARPRRRSGGSAGGWWHPPTAGAWNPAFDVTPADLIDGLHHRRGRAPAALRPASIAAALGRARP